MSFPLAAECSAIFIAILFLKPIIVYNAIKFWLSPDNDQLTEVVMRKACTFF